MSEADKKDLTGYDPLQLAYMGDAVFELFVREHVLRTDKGTVNRLSKTAHRLVKAPAQAHMYFYLLPLLTAEETAVIKRGRNAKSATKAKNATVTDYRHATGLESLFGYLYLSGQRDRLYTLMEACLHPDALLSTPIQGVNHETHETR